jgi:hypothetical protein
MRTLFSGLGETFAFFGGVPRELLFDRMGQRNHARPESSMAS